MSSPAPRPADEHSPKVCWCMGVHEATLRQAILAGAREPEALREATRAGMGCGTCRTDLERLIKRTLSELEKPKRRPG